jgi:hypothetical protein
MTRMMTFDRIAGVMSRISGSDASLSRYKGRAAPTKPYTLEKVNSTRKILLSIIAVQMPFDSLIYDFFYHLIPYCDIKDAFTLTQVNKKLHKTLWNEQYAAQVMKVYISVLS